MIVWIIQKIHSRKKLNALITETAKYLPERVLTNFDLEKMVDTSDEWIQSRTGIKERRLVKKGEATSDMAANIAKQILEKSGKSPEDIEEIKKSQKEGQQ